MDNNLNFQERIAKYTKRKEMYVTIFAVSMLGLLVGVSLCSGSSSSADAAFILLYASAAATFISAVAIIMTTSSISSLKNKLAKGDLTEIPTFQKVINLILSVILGVGVLLLVGVGLCFGLVFLSSR